MIWRPSTANDMDTLNARISIALAAAAASLALVSTATATTGTPTDTTAPTTTLPQRGLDQGASVGTFDAEGRGVVIVRGNLTSTLFDLQRSYTATPPEPRTIGRSD